MADSSDSAVKSIKLPTFDGEQKGFQIWWMRFCAYGTVYGFAQSIQQRPDQDLPSSEYKILDTAMVDGARAAKVVKLNAVAMCNLTMAFTTESLMGLIYSAISPAWLSGKAHVVVVLLHEKYAPKDLVSKIELRRNLNSILMKKYEDPVKLFEKIAALQNRYNTASYQIPLDEMIATVLEKAPKEYGTVLTVEQRMKGSNLTMVDLQETMTQLFRTTHRVEDETEDKNEMGLTMADIKCYRCGKKGHKGYQCNKKAREKKGNRSKEKCSCCGKTGNSTDDCFDDPKNAGKRPHWYRVRKGKGKRNEGDSDEEGEVNAYCQDVAPE
eukprot:15359734-Ditylum_brightwellii.AAC.1